MKTAEVGTARFIISESKHPQVVLIFTPALGVPADYYLPLAESLNLHGIVVILNELRGNGMSTIVPGRNVDFGYGDLINQDLNNVVMWTGKNFPELPLLMGGHSLGGHLAFLYIAKYAVTIRGLLLIASSLPYFKMYPLVKALQIYLGSYVFRLTTRLFGYLPGKWFGFGRREAKTLIDEWSFIARTNRFKINGDPLEYNQALTRITCRP
jgi:predicted alpha/beta hydrolase